MYLSFGLGPQLAVLRGQSWICTQELLPVPSGDHVGCLRLHLGQPHVWQMPYSVLLLLLTQPLTSILILFPSLNILLSCYNLIQIEQIKLSRFSHKALKIPFTLQIFLFLKKLFILLFIFF